MEFNRDIPGTINISGHLMNLDVPKVMGILNVTPDSFYAGSRCFDIEAIKGRIQEIVEEGAHIIDIGGCSTRPGFAEPTEEEELKRVSEGCEIIRQLYPDIPVSIDTYRSSVAEEVINRYGVQIVNDISGGKDPEMWNMVSRHHVAYILTHNSQFADNDGDITAKLVSELAKKAGELHRLGINDVILDPGFGFGKTREQNFKIFEDLPEIKKIGLPLLVGISRKSMIYKTLGVSPEESGQATVALDAIALEKGADILRVHDVRAAVETVKLYREIKRFAR